MTAIASISVGSLTLGTGTPKICVPITGKINEEIIEQTKKIKAAAPDIVEWRGDLYTHIMDRQAVLSMAEAVHKILDDIPLLFTFRTKNEGGNRAISVEEYKDLNLAMSASEYVQLIDVEVYMDFEQMPLLIDAIHKNGKPVIGSHHRFDCTPSRSDMIHVLKGIELAGADILKLAVMPHEEKDVEELITATREAISGSKAASVTEAAVSPVTHPVVTMSMGTLGVRTRIEGKCFGSSMTFGCVGETSAPGQMEIEELRAAMKRINAPLVETF